MSKKKRVLVKARRVKRKVMPKKNPKLELVPSIPELIKHEDDLVVRPLPGPVDPVCEKPKIPSVDIINIRQRNENGALRDVFQ